MKIQFVPLFICIGILFSLAACKSETPETLIVSKWMLQDMILAPGMTLPDSMKAEMLKSVTLEFTADHQYDFKGMGDNHSTGVYKLSNDGKVLTLSPTGTEKPYDNPVDELTKTKLVMTDPMGNKLVCKH